MEVITTLLIGTTMAITTITTEETVLHITTLDAATAFIDLVPYTEETIPIPPLEEVLVLDLMQQQHLEETVTPLLALELIILQELEWILLEIATLQELIILQELE